MSHGSRSNWESKPSPREADAGTDAAINRSNGPVGLIAGAGGFPLEVAKKGPRTHVQLVTIALRDHASPELASHSDRFFWTGLAKIGRMIRIFKSEGVHHWVMAGKVHKTRIVGTPWRIIRFLPDLRALRMWYRRVR